MENQMTKEQVIEATIQVLSNISVPVAKKREIADPIEGCIQNLEGDRGGRCRAGTGGPGDRRRRTGTGHGADRLLGKEGGNRKWTER